MYLNFPNSALSFAGSKKKSETQKKQQNPITWPKPVNPDIYGSKGRAVEWKSGFKTAGREDANFPKRQTLIAKAKKQAENS